MRQDTNAEHRIGPVADEPALLERDDELAALERLFDAARTGAGTVVAVRGPAGIGKSALVTRALARYGADFRVLRIAGSRSEQDVPLAGLHLLSCSLTSRAGVRGAHRLLSVAGLAPADDLRSSISAAGAGGPLACVVEDAQWLDPASLAVLGEVMSRPDGLGTVLIVVHRDGEAADAAALARLPALRPEALSTSAARALLAAQLPTPLDPQVRNRIVAEARGNPGMLTHVCGSPWESAGGFAYPRPRWAADPDGVVASLDVLPPSARLLATAAAADPTGDPKLLAEAARHLGLPRDAGRTLLTAGLLTWETHVRFAAPHVRSAVYHGAAPADRRAVHRALAYATNRRHAPDRCAWHTALAGEAPDESVAQRLIRTASRAGERGGLPAAAAFLELAAARTPDRAHRSERLLAAADVRRRSGDLRGARALISAVHGPLREGSGRVAADLVAARLDLAEGHLPRAVARLVAGWQSAARTDPAAGDRALREARAVVLRQGRLADPAVVARIASASAGSAPPDDGHRDDIMPFGIRARDEWDEDDFRRTARRGSAAARRNGSLALLPVALADEALWRLHAGDFAGARGSADRSDAAAATLGVPGLAHVGAAVAAWQGHQARVERLIAHRLPEVTARGDGWSLTGFDYARAVLLNGSGRYADALAAGRLAAELDEPGFRAWLPAEVIEAAVRTGRIAIAVPLLERLSSASTSGSPWRSGIVARCRALLSTGDEAERLYREAIDRLTGTSAVPQLARTHLLYGEWLRRARRRREARGRLRLAYEQLTAVGATAFADRARRELTATGSHPRRDGSHGGGSLTAQELTVVRMVADGATTREVAQTLYLSPRTVDAHLRNVFAKLGITSRRELVETVRRMGPELEGAAGATLRMSA